MILPEHRLTMTKTGMGLIAEEPIKKGDTVWKHSCQHEFRLPQKVFLAIKQYGYLDGNDVVVDLDESKFWNHSCNPNVINSGNDCVAVRDIKPGEELTWDYGTSSLQDFDCKCGSRNCIGKVESGLPQLERPWLKRKQEITP